MLKEVFTMRRILIMGLAGFAGWASPATAGLFSSTGPVIAIFAGELFLGEAKGNLDGSGTIRIQSSTKPDVTCRGQFTSSAELGGAGSLLCSDSATATIKFQRLSILRGYGTGSSSRGPMSFTYGLSANESKPYLKLPHGQRAQGARKRSGACGRKATGPGDTSGDGSHLHCTRGRAGRVSGNVALDQNVKN